MNNSFNCIIIDDDEVDRLAILSFARNYSFLNIVGVYASVREALAGNETKNTEILLCDICMPLKTGLDLRRQLPGIPVCIFITAYTEFAIESYELAAFDFLVKPVSKERFALTMGRLENYLNIRKDAIILQSILIKDTLEDVIFIKDGHDHIKIKLTDIIYLEALKDYTLLFTFDKKYYLLSSIGSSLNQRKFQSFIRVHRSYAVQKQFIQKITYNQIVVSNIHLPIGRIYKDNLEVLKG